MTGSLRRHSRLLPVALASLACLTLQASSGDAAQESPSKGIFSLPNRTWGVVLDLPGFTIERIENRSDGRRYLLAKNDASGVIVSVFLEEILPAAAHKGCEESLKRKPKATEFAKKDVRLWESGDYVFLEYIIPSVNGVPVRQKNFFACRLRDNVFIDFHFSKTDYKSEDNRLFTAILESVSFQEGISRNSKDYMQMASLYYMRQDYLRAIPSYEAALALEKEKRTLERNQWYVLIDNLAMSHGSLGALDKAQDVLRYGLSQDPEYPMFHYILACVYAEKGEAEGAKISLERAYALKQNILPSETMPDARRDDAFKQLMKKREFREFVEALMKQ